MKKAWGQRAHGWTTEASVAYSAKWGESVNEGVALGSSLCLGRVRYISDWEMSIDFGKDYYRRVVGSESN